MDQHIDSCGQVDFLYSPVLSVVIVVHGFLNVFVVIAAYHNYIIKGWWKLKHVVWDLLAQTDRYFIDRKKVNPDLFVIELEICTCIYNIVNLLKSYDNIHSMSYTTKIMLTGIAIRNTGYVL